ncbi:MAG: Crp/Fnr family transcriptional regulator [Thermoanaerobaculia bacterium]
MAESLEQLLAAVTMFRKLGGEDRERLAAVSQLRSYERGDIIFREADPSAWFFVVARGRVKIVKSTPTGRDVILEVFGAGDPFGSVAAFEGLPYPATAIAIEPTVCILTRREAFFGLLVEHPSLVRGLLSGLTMRLVELTNRLAEMSGGKVEPRVARLFLKLADEKGRPHAEGTFIAHPLSRQEIADLCGTTIETAIRVMSRWGKDGVVRTERDGFVLLDREALDALALG